MTVSIIICTKDRAPSLGLTLQSIGRASVPVGWCVELIVVDNGSSDQTATVVSEAGLRNVTIRYLKETRVGLCYARNSGLVAALGEVLLFTDDDVRVPVGWIEGICHPLLQGSADAMAGGVTFPDNIATALASGPLHDKRGWLASTDEINPSHPDRMVGANMALHRRIIESGLRFDVELGAGGVGFAEETVFSWQLMSRGFKLRARFDVAVEHHFDIARLTPEKMVDLARRLGRTRAFIFHHWEHRRSRLILFHLLRSYGEIHYAKWRGSRAKSPNAYSRVLDLEERIAFCQEYLAQCWRPWKYPYSQRSSASYDVH